MFLLFDDEPSNKQYPRSTAAKQWILTTCSNDEDKYIKVGIALSHCCHHSPAFHWTWFDKYSEGSIYSVKLMCSLNYFRWQSLDFESYQKLKIRTSFCCNKIVRNMHLSSTKVAVKSCIYAEAFQMTVIYSSDLFTYNAECFQTLSGEKWW